MTNTDTTPPLIDKIIAKVQDAVDHKVFEDGIPVPSIAAGIVVELATLWEDDENIPTDRALVDYELITLDVQKIILEHTELEWLSDAMGATLKEIVDTLDPDYDLYND
jgi:hypothetical protein